MNQNGGCRLLPCCLFRRTGFPSTVRKAGLTVLIVFAGLMRLMLIAQHCLAPLRDARSLGFQTHPNRNLHRCSYQNLPGRYFENSVLDRRRRYLSTACRHFCLWNEIEPTLLLLVAKLHF